MLNAHSPPRASAPPSSLPSSTEEVELLARGMRHWDSDGVILEDAAQLGEMVIKVGSVGVWGDVVAWSAVAALSEKCGKGATASVDTTRANPQQPHSERGHVN